MTFRPIFYSLIAILFAATAFAQPSAEPATGEELVAQLRAMQPGENSEISGVLKIRAPNRRIEIPVVCTVVTNGDSWRVTYETRATTTSGAEKLVVIHTLGAPNQYLYARASTPGADLPDLKSVSPSEAAISLAGSDFWLSELGFEFLHWPQQKKLKGEMRLGQPCYVLESVDPNGPVIARVKSYIDKESGGILIAEAFDNKGKTVKEFSLSGSSFKKINGRWQVKKMRISSPKIDSETTLEFDLSEN